MPETLAVFMGRVLQCTRPSKPSSIPRASHPNPTDVLTAARMTAFRAGQSPPPVRMPIRMTHSSWDEEIVLEEEPFSKLFHNAYRLEEEINETSCTGHHINRSPGRNF